MAVELLSLVDVGAGGATSISFGSIPEEGQDLVIEYSGRTSATGYSAVVVVKINNSLNGFSQKQIRALSTSAASFNRTNGYVTYGLTAASMPSGNFASGSIFISDYTRSADKLMIYESQLPDGASNGFSFVSAVTNGQAAITSIDLENSDGFLEHSSASLYKIS